MQPLCTRKSVAIGGTSSWQNVNGPFTVGLYPGGGGTLTCKVRVHPADNLVVIQAGTASYAADTVVSFPGPVYEIVVEAAVAIGNFSVAQPQ